MSTARGPAPRPARLRGPAPSPAPPRPAAGRPFLLGFYTNENGKQVGPYHEWLGCHSEVYYGRSYQVHAAGDGAHLPDSGVSPTVLAADVNVHQSMPYGAAAAGECDRAVRATTDSIPAEWPPYIYAMRVDHLDALMKALDRRSALVREGAARGLARRVDAEATRALFDGWRERRLSGRGAAAPSSPGSSPDDRAATRLLELLAARLSDPLVGDYFLRPVDAHAPGALDDVVAALCQSGHPAAQAPLFDVLERGPGSLKARAAHGVCKRPLDRVGAERLAATLRRGFWPGDHLDPCVLSSVVPALFAHDARWAFDALAPAIDARECSDRFGAARAAGILSGLERLLDAASCAGDAEAPSLPDPRWRARCASLLEASVGPRRPPGQALASSVADPASIARRVVAGLRWFEEGRPARPPLEVEFANDGPGPMPLFIAGFLIGDARGDLADRLRAWRPRAPAGLCLFRHQFGGHACRQATLLGYALAPEPAFAAGEAFASLQSATSDSDGDALTRPDLHEWNDRLGLAPALPFVEGWEALLFGPPGPPLTPLHGLGVLGFRAVIAPWNELASFWASRPDVEPLGPFGPAHEKALYEAGVAFGFGAPCLALVWENSD